MFPENISSTEMYWDASIWRQHLVMCSGQNSHARHGKAGSMACWTILRQVFEKAQPTRCLTEKICGPSCSVTSKDLRRSPSVRPLKMAALVYPQARSNCCSGGSKMSARSCNARERSHPPHIRDQTDLLPLSPSWSGIDQVVSSPFSVWPPAITQARLTGDVLTH